MRRAPIYHSTYTGKPPDEPAVLGVALNEVFVPLLQKQFPEIVDFYLPPEGCSYRLAVVSMKKQYPGHAKRVMFGVWSYLRQFMYTKFIIVMRRRRERARLEGSDLGADHARRPGARHDAGRRTRRSTTWISPARSPAWARRWASTPPTSGRRRPRRWGRPIAMDAEVKRRVDRALAGPRALTHCEQRVKRRLGLRRVRVVDDHHHRVAAPAAVEDVARHRARVGEQPGLDMRIARRRRSPCRRLRIVPSAATTGSEAMNSGITGLRHAACSSAISVAALARSLRERPEPFSSTSSGAADALRA